jgi:hypothetical protein
MTPAPPARRLAFREACYELRRTGRLYEDGKITIDVWCSSVHRILRAAGYATSAVSGRRGE